MSGRGDRLGAKVVGFTLLGLLVLVGAAYVGLNLWAGDRVPRSAEVEGVAIGGMDASEAEATLERELSDRERERIRVTFGDGRESRFDPQAAGLRVDHAASVEQAMGGAAWTPGRTLAVLTGGGDRAAVVDADPEELSAALDRLDAALGSRPVEGTVAFRDGQAVAVYGKPGRVVDRGVTARLLERRFLHEGPQKVPTRIDEPSVSDAAVDEALAGFGRPAMSAPVTLVLGGQRVQAPPPLFGQGLSMVAQDGRLVPQVDGEKMVDALGPAMRTIGRQPQDARFVVRDGKPRIVPARVGVEFDPADLEAGFAEAAVQSGAARVLEVDGRTSQPDFTTKDAEALGIKRRVSTWTTNFPYAEYRNVNLPRAAELIDGTILRPGETFSLNGIVGERTKENGFTEGYVVSDGIFKKDLGGGVSQIATTTFNAMFFAGLRDVQHKPHSVFIDRYPVGREATVAWPTLDLKFTNDTPHGILVKASVVKATPSSQGAATVSMYSTKTWDVTARESAKTNFTSPEVRYLQDPDCEEFDGTSGFDITVYRDFRRPGSSKLVRTEAFKTRYIAGDEVRCGPDPRG